MVIQVAEDDFQSAWRVMQDDQDLVAWGHGKHVVYVKVIAAEVYTQRIGRSKRHAVFSDHGKIAALHAHGVLAIHVIYNAGGAALPKAENIECGKVIRGINQLRGKDKNRRIKLELHKRSGGMLYDKARRVGISAVKNIVVRVRDALLGELRIRLGIAQVHSQPERHMKL